MEVKDENDKIPIGKQAMVYPDGKPQGHYEQEALECQLLPGVNQRRGMPEKASLKIAVREQQQSSIIQFCNLAPPMIKRSLILRAFEQMMKKEQPEQNFNFLDRNYQEEYKDRNTMRQILSSAMSCL